MVGVEAEVWQAPGERLKTDAGFQSGQVDPKADVRALGEGQVTPRPRPAGGVSVGMLEDRRIAVGGGDRHLHEVAFVYVRGPQRGLCGCVPVDDGGGRLEPERLVDDRV